MTHKPKKIALIAPTGMLGIGVYQALKDSHELILVARNQEKLAQLDKRYGDIRNHTTVVFDINEIWNDFIKGFQATGTSPAIEKLKKELEDIDAVINCAGIIKPHSLTDPAITLFINGVFPHILSNIYKEKLIQITTDCVYDGLKGAPYDESSQKNPVDLYGISKSLGEPNEALVLRTSIVGEELGTQTSLIEWFKSQRNKTMNGFTNHFWNGITTLQFGKICKHIIENRNAFPTSGTYHIFSNKVSKYEMLLEFKKKFNIPCEIQNSEAEIPIDRTLATKHSLNKALAIPSFSEMVAEL